MQFVAQLMSLTEQCFDGVQIPRDTSLLQELNRLQPLLLLPPGRVLQERHALLVVRLLRQVQGGQAESVPDQQVGALLHQDADVGHVAVLGGDVERGARLAADAAHGVQGRAGLGQDAKASIKEITRKTRLE